MLCPGFTAEGGLKVLGGDRKVDVLLAVGVDGEKVSKGDRGVGGKFVALIMYGCWHRGYGKWVNWGVWGGNIR